MVRMATDKETKMLNMRVTLLLARIETGQDGGRLARQCSKSHRLASAWWSEQGQTFHIDATNSPPRPFRCAGESCKAGCGKLAVHAEERVVMSLLTMASFRAVLPTVEMLHIKINDQCEPVAGGPPSCITCARQILEAGLKGIWLSEVDKGWQFYTAREFYVQTLKALGLPEPRIRGWGGSL